MPVPRVAYTFKHALTQQVAYKSLLQERRRRLHARIVEAIEVIYASHLTTQIERLAHHAFRGELWGKVLSYCRQAGLKVAARSAYREAVVFFEQALVALKHLPTQQDTLEQAIDVRLELRNALALLDEHSKIADCLWEAKALAEAIGDQQRLGWILCHQTQLSWTLGDYDQGIAVGQSALVAANACNDLALKVAANYHLSVANYALGEYQCAIDLLRENVGVLTGDLIQERLGMANVASVLSGAFLAL